MSIDRYILSLFQHKRLYWVICILFFIALLFRIPELEIWLLPKLAPSRYFILTEFPNHSAEDTDLLVSLPISEMVSSVKSVERIRTISEHGKSIVQINLQFGASLSEFKDQLYQTILEMKDKLPLGAGNSRLLQGEISERPFMEILIRKKNKKEIVSFDFHLQQLVFQLERISGVSEVRTVGESKKSSFISLDSKVLDLFPIDIREVEQQLQSGMRGGSLGSVEGYTKDTELKFAPEIHSQEDLSLFPVHLGNGNSVGLGRLAKIYEDQLPSEKLTRNNGKAKIYIAVFSDPSSNPLKLSSEIKSKLKQLEPDLSSVIFYDGSDELEKQLGQFGINGIWGLVFAFLFSYLLYRNWTPALILLLSVLFSLVLFFHLLLFFSISVNLLSLGGISVGIGMLFDASNLTVFSIRKQLANDSSVVGAVTEGIRSILVSLFSSSLTTIVVFVPLLMFPMEWKDFFFDSGVCIALLVFCSLVSSIFIVPLVSISFADFLKPKNQNAEVENTLTRFYERTYGFYKIWNYKAVAIFVIFVLSFSIIHFGPKFEIFPKQEPIGFRLEMIPLYHMSLEDELIFVMEMEKQIKTFDSKLSTLIVPIDVKNTLGQHPQKAIPIQCKLLGVRDQIKLETFLSAILSKTNWEWKIEVIESQVSTTLPLIPADSLLFFHDNWEELKSISYEFENKSKRFGFVGKFDFLPKQIVLEEWDRNQIPVPELMPDEEDLKLKFLYHQIPKYLGSVGETTKHNLYLGLDSFSSNFWSWKDLPMLTFKTKTNESTYIGSLFTSRKRESYHQYRRDSGLFYTEWIGEFTESDPRLMELNGNLSILRVSAQNQIKKFYLILVVLLFIAFVFIYLALVGIYESFGIPLLYLGISLLYLTFTTSVVLVLFQKFHLGHYIGLIVLLGLSIDSISLFGERWKEIPEEIIGSKRRELVFHWLVWPILLNSGTTMMGLFPVIVLGNLGSEFPKAIALTMFVGIFISIFFVFYIYPTLFSRFWKRM
ncbi:efflux RND transporter permease subunit [Leptospira sp. 201903074]|uniref:efflux RND transporter permease subunit n=1 Tax=Leptospira abararensis TaxID=2810036 RepID=UPI00196474BE|nr:efflux RND transporter permease subunit [Leptospira abararensis]MBM9547904.1 efflux RND transporter permease subunit [Leptospira abararensis]